MWSRKLAIPLGIAVPLALVFILLFMLLSEALTLLKDEAGAFLVRLSSTISASAPSLANFFNESVGQAKGANFGVLFVER